MPQLITVSTFVQKSILHGKFDSGDLKLSVESQIRSQIHHEALSKVITRQNVFSKLLADICDRNYWGGIDTALG